MIEQYLKLLESFKENKISELIQTINDKALTALRSSKFNPRIAAYLATMHAEGVPFTDFAEDPDNISQIKKLFNALYHARLAFLDLESLDVRNLDKTIPDLTLLYNNTVHQAYQASYLLTHWDVDLTGILEEESKLILPLLDKFKVYADSLSKETQHIANQFNNSQLSYNAGWVSGVAIDQMQPSSGDLDYNFLAHFGAVLPGYIDQFTQYVSTYSSQIIENESALNKEKIKELQNAAYKLLTNLDNLKSGWFLPLKYLNYIHIVRNVITLSMSTLDELGHFNESTQDVIRDKLELLKYTVLPTLFGLVDKIEDNTMLQPGTLSTPLLEKIKPLYQWLIFYTSKYVDFNAKGEELLSIEDPRFLSLRLELTYKRIDEANKSLFKIKQAQEAYENFFTILSYPVFANVSLRKLPDGLKKELITWYKLIGPYMAKINVDLNNSIIDSLNNSVDWTTDVGDQLLWAASRLPSDHVSFILAEKKAVGELINKDKFSQEFHIDLNKDLIDSVQQNTNLVLFPYKGDNPFIVDEATILKAPTKTEQLAQALELKDAQVAFNLFFHILENPIYSKLALTNLPQSVKRELRDLYKTLETTIKQIDPVLNNAITSALFTQENTAAYIDNTVLWAMNYKPVDQISNVLAHKRALQNRINLEQSKQHLYFGSGESIVDGLAKQTNFDLLTPQSKTFIIDQKSALNLADSAKAAIAALEKHPEMQEAFTQFFTIIDDALYANTCLGELPKEVKTKLMSFYKTLQVNMSKLSPDLDKVIIERLNAPESWSAYLGKQLRWASGYTAVDHISLIQAQKAALKNLIDQDKTNNELLIKVNKAFVTESPQHTCAAGNTYLVDKTPMQTLEQRALAKLEFVTAQGGSKVLLDETANLDLLSCDQALDLYQHYNNKLLKFNFAHQAYVQFIDILNTATDESKDSAQPLHIDKLHKDVRENCRNLYNVFQPYFVAALPTLIAEMPDAIKGNADSFDKLIAHLLCNKMAESAAPRVDLFNTLDDKVQEYFTAQDLNWKKKSRLYLKLAQKKFVSENADDVLEKDIHNEQRAHHLIHHTHYSKFLNEFRANLYQLTEFFNQSMKAQLRAQTVGVPFPEVEENNTILAQPQQVLSVKRIFNNFYHLEGIALELEKLNNQHSEMRYVYHLLRGYGHINEIVKLSRGLVADPHFRLIATELMEKAQRFLFTLQGQSEAYQLGSELAGNDGKQAEHNSLWYVLNAFYIAPAHIRTISNNSYITTEELNELHAKAKESTIRIEKIINSSDSYFKLFLQAPSMYKLYQDLTTKLNEFTSTAHDAVMNNLDSIRANIFTPMLLEADEWEEKLGLSPGFLAGPLKEITDEYFKGLLTPLDLHSKTHIGLVCDHKTLEKRQERARKVIEKAKKPLQENTENYELFSSLHQLMRAYLYPTPDPFKTPEILEAEAQKTKEELIATYKKAQFKLMRIKDKFIIEAHTDPKMQELDTLLNGNSNEYDPKFTHIMPLVEAASHYYQGQQATHQLTTNIAQEQLAYFDTLAKAHPQEDIDFIGQYTESSFTKQMEAYCNCHIGLQYTYKEYSNELRAYLLTLKDNITRQAKKAEDIDLALKNLLTEKIKIFEQKNVTKYYQLDTVKAALAQFNTYISTAWVAVRKNNSIFESARTLDKKTLLINRLDEAAGNGFLTIEEHIHQLRTSKRAPEEVEALCKELYKLSDSKKLTIAELISNIKKSNKTTEEKATLFASLSDLSEKVQLTIEERIDYIREKTDSEEFRGTILAHDNPDAFSFAFLKKCFLALLEALHLYTPTRKRLLNNMTNAINNPPEISHLTNRYGLFASNVAPEVKGYDAPSLPQASPAA